MLFASAFPAVLQTGSYYHLLSLEVSAGKLLFSLILAGNNNSKVKNPSEEQETRRYGTSRVFPASPESSTGP